MQDDYEIDGVQTPRIFVSAHDLTGLPALRERLAQIVLEHVGQHEQATQDPRFSGVAT